MTEEQITTINMLKKRFGASKVAVDQDIYSGNNVWVSAQAGRDQDYEVTYWTLDEAGTLHIH